MPAAGWVRAEDKTWQLLVPAKLTSRTTLCHVIFGSETETTETLLAVLKVSPGSRSLEPTRHVIA